MKQCFPAFDINIFAARIKEIPTLPGWWSGWVKKKMAKTGTLSETNGETDIIRRTRVERVNRTEWNTLTRAAHSNNE